MDRANRVPGIVDSEADEWGKPSAFAQGPSPDMKQGFPLALGYGAVKRPGRIIAVLIERPTGRREP